LHISPFLQVCDKLTAAEEIKTKPFARVRINVERAIDRIKKFKVAFAS